VVPEKAVHVLPGTFGPRVKVPAAARRRDFLVNPIIPIASIAGYGPFTDS
jgi:hypothetical protein